MRRVQAFGGDERGVSEVVGAGLLIGIVLTAAVFTVIVGSSAINDVRGQTNQEQAETVLQEVDSRFASVAASSERNQEEIDLSDSSARDFDLDRSGWVNVTVNERGACAANVTMGSIRYEAGSDDVLAYEAGGAWERSPTNGTRMITPPDVGYRAGTIDVRVTNVTGTVDQTFNSATYQEAISNAETTKLNQRIFSGGCVQPDNVTLNVTTDYYQAWGRYLGEEFDTSVHTDHSENEVSIQLDQSQLPDHVNNNVNNVVNLSDARSGVDVPYLNADVGSGNEWISVDKGHNNPYSVSMRPLNENGLDVGNITNVENATSALRPPIDVVFVVDESGSMDEDDDDHIPRIEEAREGAKRFVGQLNESRDRVGVVGFDDSGRYHLTDGGNGDYISGDFTAVNQTIDGLDAIGGTRSQTGMELGNNIMELRSDDTRNKVVVLLTDGVNNDCQDRYAQPMYPETNNDDPTDCSRDSDSDNKVSLEMAEDAAANDVTIYTIGYGEPSYIDQGFLRAVADRANGNYHLARDSDELDEVFDEIVREVQETKAIALSPVSTNATSNQVYAPQAVGDTDDVARFNISGQEFANINDPTAGSQFSHSFAVTGGDEIELKAYDFSCNEWRTTGRTESHNGTAYDVVRCTDIVQDSTLRPDDIFLDGDNIEASHGILTEDRAWWQDDINDTFDAQSDTLVNRTSGPNFGDLELKSNQALLHWDLEDGNDSSNRLFMLFEIGIAESEADTSGVINIEVSSVNLD